jgi:hypothetical protein
MRPPWKIGPVSPAATAHTSEPPLVIADISGLAVPRMPVRLSLGKNSALATPTCALARTNCCSTWRRSGRRWSRVEGNPAGTVGATGCPYIGVPRGIGAGALPRRMLIWFSFARTRFSSSGMFACAPPSAPSAHGPRSVAVSPDGRSAYTVSANDDVVSQYDVDPQSGAAPKAPASVPSG